MRNRSPISSTTPIHRINGPVELLEAVPYLLGFHPRRSVVLVGLRSGRLVVTARLDTVDAMTPAVLDRTVASMVQGGASSVIGVGYAESAQPQTVVDGELSWLQFADRLRGVAEGQRCELGDALLVSEGRWWSLTCDVAECCPPAGRELPETTSAFAALATFQGRVALPDRESMEALLDPLPEAERQRLDPLIADEERAAVQAVLRGDRERQERALKRKLFAAARASAAPPTGELQDTDLARFGVALSMTEFRDSLWIAVDSGRIDGRPLWLEFARRLPPPYDAPALLLFGWASWRAGDCTRAGIAAERALASDPLYTAADLLMAAVTSGVSPHSVPRLRPAAEAERSPRGRRRAGAPAPAARRAR